MKVTVCFGETRVVVPCGDGSILIRDLTVKSILRYKKATGKPSNHWVRVNTLQSLTDGGIFDADDKLIDVADDREQIIADYEEAELSCSSSQHHNNGDGTSASSAGTASPDIFTSRHNGTDHQSYYNTNNTSNTSSTTNNDVVITPSDLAIGTSLTVRRGSEPSLVNIGTTTTPSADTKSPPATPIDKQLNIKRWSGVNDVNRDEKVHSGSRSTGSSPQSVRKSVIVGGNDERTGFSAFNRDSARKSLGNMPSMFKWLEAQERAQEQHEEKERQALSPRKEPVGGAADEDENTELELRVEDKRNKMIVIQSEPGPLGIHVVPEYDDKNREIGLIIQGIEPGGRIHRDGRLEVDDRIIEINARSLYDMDFIRAQEIFKEALLDKDLRLRVVKPATPDVSAPVLDISQSSEEDNGGRRRVPPPIKPKPNLNKLLQKQLVTTTPNKTIAKHSVLQQNGGTGSSGRTRKISSSSNSGDTTQQSKPVSLTTTTTDLTKSDLKLLNGGNSRPKSTDDSTPEQTDTTASAPVIDGDTTGKTTGLKTPPKPPARSPNTSLSGDGSAAKSLFNAPTNTRKIGVRIPVELTKGALGLGFSITTRDYQALGNCPIYIKNILPKGAAIDDGRLKPGDRLLEVNGEDLTNKLQSDVVNILRNAPQGSRVQIVVSRQEPEDKRFSVPRELPKDRAEYDSDVESLRRLNQIKLEIPLNDTGSAGLGVSVKGKTITQRGITRDLGIFVKAVITGGAAFKDGNLKVNDQLIEVNRISLIGKSNGEAMDCLRRAMQADGPVRGHILLAVTRRTGAPTPTPSDGGSFSFENLGDDHEESSVSTTTPAQQTDTSVLISSGGQQQYSKSSIVASGDDELAAPSTGSMTNGFNDSVTLNATIGETLMIDDTVTQRVNVTPQKPRPRSSLGFVHPPTVPTPDNSPSDSVEQTVPQTPTEDDPAMIPFEREGYGRRSMSEKRHGHEDAKKTETYQKLKANKKKDDDEEETKSSSSPRNDSDVKEEKPAADASKTGSGEIPPPPPALRNLPPPPYPGGHDGTASWDRRLIGNNRRAVTGSNDDASSWDRRRFRPITVISSGIRSSWTEIESLDKEWESLVDQCVTQQQEWDALLRPGFSPPSPAPSSELSSYMHGNQSNLHDENQSDNFAVSRRHGGSQPNLTLISPNKVTRAGSADCILNPSSSELDNYRSSSQSELTGGDTIGPTLGMKKSSSLESLQAMVKEIVTDDDGYWRTPSAVVRGRGCNESFRAAVDRSYDEQPLETMDALEEEGSEILSISRQSNSARSSFSYDGGNHQKTPEKKQKQNKEKKGGIFKGLFHRKSGKNKTAGKNAQIEAQRLRDQEILKHQQEQILKKQAEFEKQKLEQQKRLQEKQQQQESSYQRHIKERERQSPIQPPGGVNRAEWIHQLRHEHQRRHRERQGVYPTESRDDDADKEMMEIDEQRRRAEESSRWRHSHYDLMPPRYSSNQNPYHRGQHVSSRGGNNYSDPRINRDNYDHYQNLDEIKAAFHRQDQYRDIYAQRQELEHARRMEHARRKQAQIEHSRQVALQQRHYNGGSGGEPIYDHIQHVRMSSGEFYRASTGQTAREQRARSQTPVKGYLGHTHYNKKPLGSSSSVPPSIVINDPSDSNVIGDYDDPRKAYRETAPTYRDSGTPTYRDYTSRTHHPPPPQYNIADLRSGAKV